jgi:hypothetical protein
MARKRATEPEPPPVPQVGERCMRPGSDGICEVDYVSKDGTEVTISSQNAPLLKWFRVPVSTLIWIDSKE